MSSDSGGMLGAISGRIIISTSSGVIVEISSHILARGLLSEQNIVKFWEELLEYYSMKSVKGFLKEFQKKMEESTQKYSGFWMNFRVNC